ncbi:MAG: hypothetical protein P4M15_12150 [Alphaproteobacteria bacterium]|nr:hypothetical protein [Alphaproteobacteria bacterium]
MKPIVEQFRAAGRLVNEWRDTISYGLLTAYAADQAVFQGHPDWVLKFFAIVMARETLRGACWRFASPPVLAGAPNSRFNPDKNYWGSLIIAGLFGTAFDLGLICFPQSGFGIGPLIFNNWGGLAGLPFAAYGTWSCFKDLQPRGLGIGDIFNLYFNKETGMWDWPRKRGNGGGTTQTEKMKEAVAGFVKRHAPGAARPASATRVIAVSRNNFV